MTPATFLRTVLLLYGDHWQPPCRELLARHGHHPTRQTLWNWKTGNSPLPESVAVILKAERRAKRLAGSVKQPPTEGEAV